MKTRTSIKSNAFISKFQTRLGLNKSGIKVFVSAFRKNVFSEAINSQLEQRQESSLKGSGICLSRGQMSIKKLESSIKCGFDSVASKYNNFFRAGQKTQQNKAQQYLEGIFCADKSQSVKKYFTFSKMSQN